jgi:hypothetical protein|tara:strand:- start:1102 stop:1308 length:207 start_codon:yes stop_codon:yes gene_type:complete
MTVSEKVAVLESRMTALEKRIDNMDKKLDQLIEAAYMGKGAWWMLLRVGAVFVLASGLVAWLVDKILK